jgi:hypothetical protein
MRTLLVSLVAVAALVGCGGASDRQTSASLGSELNSGSPTTGGIQPDAFDGNFGGDGAHSCAEMRTVFGWELTGEMIGVKVDPPAGFSDGYVDFTVRADYLDWKATAGVEMLGVIGKGGPTYNAYDYVGSGLLEDTALHAPVNPNNGKLYGISHYNFCYRPVPKDEQGCTPGYWRNHADRWSGVMPDASFDAVFGVTSGLGSSFTLGEAVKAEGGGAYALARHATAALLNAYGGVPNADDTTVKYPLSAEEVKEQVQAAFADASETKIEVTKDLLADDNELGCPLSGTKAVEVK